MCTWDVRVHSRSQGARAERAPSLTLACLEGGREALPSLSLPFSPRRTHTSPSRPTVGRQRPQGSAAAASSGALWTHAPPPAPGGPEDPFPSRSANGERPERRGPQTHIKLGAWGYKCVGG